MKKKLMSETSSLSTVARVCVLLCVATSNVDAQSMPNQATILVAASEPAKPYDPMIFGGFIEYLGRQIYGGIFEPASTLPTEKLSRWG